MAAYAALTSLKSTINQLQSHPSPPISINEQQAESLVQKVTFLQEFLEGYISPVADSHEVDPLEIRIADAAYSAEDVIESHILAMIDMYRSSAAAAAAAATDDKEEIEIDYGEGTSTSDGSKNQRKPTVSFDFFGCLRKNKKDHVKEIDYIPTRVVRKAIKNMGLIKNEVMEMAKEKGGVVEAHVSAPGGGSSSSSSRSSIMVGFDEVLLEILDKLTGGYNTRQVVPIVGMGGIGKTTLARHVYALPFIKGHFDVCAWATISQKYHTKEILYELLSQANKKSRDEFTNMSEDELGTQLHKYLFGRRFLIVMDDMWNIDAWENVQRFFPNNGNGSRVLVTTRLSTLGSQLDNNYSVRMKFLDEVSSWDLLSKCVFGEESCPLELAEIGKEIVGNCRGLPLSIVVLGGLLKTMEGTKGCWESIRKNSSSLVNSENEDFCLKMLKMSYNHLPVYLKPCFLYMGVFEEDRVIRVSTLVKLWVSEGFLKPISDKSLETVAKEYLTDLVDRNLILVHELGCTGNIKYCKIHDLLRDLCWREAEREGFYNVTGQQRFKGLNRQRRAVICESTSKEEICDVLRSMQLARSLICDRTDVLPLPESRMLRTLKAYDRDTLGGHDYLLDDVFGFVNSRYLAVGVHHESKFLPSVGLLWNLQTLIIFHSHGVSAPDEIWRMPQLRHVEFIKGDLELPFIRYLFAPRDPSNIMRNLQTLKGVRKLDGQVSAVIPNIKKLVVTDGYRCNLFSLTKLESFRCRGTRDCGVTNSYGSFPYSLKKLSLGSSTSHWEVNVEMLGKIGALPLLQKLKLERASFKSKQWETSEDQFPSLKFLELNCCLLETWTTESSHFPHLEKLHLFGLKELEEISLEIGEIATLQSVLLEYCSEPVVESAKKIAEEQDELQVRVVLFNNDKNQALRKGHAGPPNFLVEIVDF